MTKRKPAVGLLALTALLVPSGVFAQAKPYAGITLALASQNDQFAPVLAKLAPQFEAATGAIVKVDIMDYGTLLTKTTADFVGHTKGYDLVTMDIVWSGAFAENGYTVDLTNWIKRDAAEIDTGDIYPVLMQSLGGFAGKQMAFPFAGYANVLAYRKDLYAAASLTPPKTMEELVTDAVKLTDPAKHTFGFVANGKTGPAGAQDWMQYNSQMGGSIVDAAGKPVINSAANVESLNVYKELFAKAAPPGAADYDWDGREQSFRNGTVATMETWSVGAPGYYDPKQSKVVDTVAIEAAPSAKGLPPRYGVGGWGMAINADSDPKKQEAAWAFIKWLTSPEIHKQFNLEGAGSFLRRSEMTDKDLLAKFPFLPVIATTFENGNGDYRPRIPQYPEIQDLLGTAVNAVLVGSADPKAALDEVQAKAEKLF
ncbi:extracellular solute-binding protein [Lichenifustis flavocetrariae]|uniref:Extracellular solute-binding protein n=1 Tax=Lichenifustis flavocetrariae TaxID=2949735 RepID=A0AA41YQT4_9HYPH|nr:extracellular solute-binding protein [Lichenifustis flavocetrariae]MCW6506444.1 extracellular solute-binding protein [Lichenifustis flavocetrariae]